MVSGKGPRIFWLSNASLWSLEKSCYAELGRRERENQAKGILSPQPLLPLLCLPSGDLHSCVCLLLCCGTQAEIHMASIFCGQEARRGFEVTLGPLWNIGPMGKCCYWSKHWIS